MGLLTSSAKPEALLATSTKMYALISALISAAAAGAPMVRPGGQVPRGSSKRQLLVLLDYRARSDMYYKQQHLHSLYGTKGILSICFHT